MKRKKYEDFDKWITPRVIKFRVVIKIVMSGIVLKTLSEFRSLTKAALKLEWFIGHYANDSDFTKWTIGICSRQKISWKILKTQVLADFKFWTNYFIQRGRPDFFILKKKKRKNIDVANLTADRTWKSEDMNKYLDLAFEVGEG